MASDTTLAGYRVKAGIATWLLSGDLGIGRASELHQMAVKLADDDRVRGIKIQLPEDGVPLPTFQILIALRNSVQLEGKSFEWSGSLRPYGGRPW